MLLGVINPIKCFILLLYNSTLKKNIMADAMPLTNGTVFAEASGPTCSAKKKIHAVHYIWLIIEKLEGVFVCEIPPGIPTQKNNI